MTSNNDRLELRRQAEEIARKEAAPSSEDLESRSPEGIRQTLHELRVHQLELEMQNEELRRVQAELDAARARYFDLYDLAPVGYCTLSEKGLILEANLTAATLLGVARGTLVKQPISRFIFPEDQDSYYRFRKQLFATGAPQACELRMMKKDETAFWANLAATAAQDADGAPVCRVVMSDITTRKRSEQTLRESEQRLRLAQDAARAGAWEWNLQTHENIWSEEIWPLYGLEPHSIPPSYEGWQQTLHPDDRSRVEQAVRAAVRAEREFELEWRVNAPSGPLRWLLARGRPLRDANGQVTRYLGIVMDITARRQAEDRLRLQGAALAAAANAIVITDRTGRIQWANQAFSVLTGYPLDEALGRNPRDLVRSGAHGRDFYVDLWRTILAGQVWEGEIINRRKDHSQYHEFMTITPVRDPDGTIGHFVAVKQDITARRQSEQALRESEARLLAIVQAVPDVLLVLDEEGRYVEVLTGRPELLYTEPKALQGRRLSERLTAAVTEQVLEAIRQTLRTRQIQSLEYELSIPKIGPRTFEVRLAPVDATLPGKPMVVLLAHDITQRRLTEESLRQAQKMEAVGQLTGGMAHDFNNLLAIILGNLELLAEQLQDPAMGNLVQEALVAVERGASLTHRLLAFSRRQPLRSKRTDLNQLVAGMSDLLRRSLGETIVLRTRLAENLLPTVIDPGQFEAALLNLVVNARDAMPQGGQLTIETANYWLHEDAAHTQLYEVEPGQYVMLAVGDTGSGMAPDVQRHAFEPFFTTKEVGQGSGLGLSMVYGLVKQSGGFIHLDSEVGQGTTLRLYLPAAGADAGTAVETPSEPVRPRPGQQQTILVVEDESAVRQMAVRMLESLGFQTVEADTATTALAVLDATPQAAALFTDVVLPGPLSGVELARQAVQRRPDLKVLFTSGYAEAHFRDRPAGSDLLDKPYRKAQLAEKLHALLDRGAAAESG
jgi:PAS domain S-box-containing protein